MSLQIECPHCGRRPLEEFSYGEIPTVPDSVTGEDARDLDRAFMLDNPEGPSTERWFHAFGLPEVAHSDEGHADGRGFGL